MSRKIGLGNGIYLFVCLFARGCEHLRQREKQKGKGESILHRGGHSTILSISPSSLDAGQARTCAWCFLKSLGLRPEMCGWLCVFWLP